MLPVSCADTVGGVVSSCFGATTVKVTDPASEVLPALSVARYCTVCLPTWFTDTGAV